MSDETHLLIVDDDDRIRDLLKQYLTRAGHSVTTAADAAAARKLFQTFSFDLAIFDIMMPGEDGLSLLKTLRDDGNQTPVMLLTARGQSEDRIEGLRLGADDYLPKPFEPEELALRTAAIIRRTHVPPPPDEVEMSGLVFEPTKGLLTGPSGHIRLTDSELQRLTGKSEELEFRIGRVIQDGTNRIGDLEFRLCELESGCDIGSLGDTPTLGGEDGTPVTAPAPSPQPETQLAANEQADFARAQAALAARDFRTAADQFETFNQTYPGSPLAIEATLRRGEALEGLGDVREGARAYLAAFTLDQQGPMAAEALFRLGNSLGRLGQTAEACVTLGEVGVRFPDATAVNDAEAAMRNIGCS